MRGKSLGSILHSSCLVSEAIRKSRTASSLKGAHLKFRIYSESLDIICSSLRVTSTFLWTSEQSGTFDISIVWTGLGCANTACEPASTKVKSMFFIRESYNYILKVFYALFLPYNSWALSGIQYLKCKKNFLFFNQYALSRDSSYSYLSELQNSHLNESKFALRFSIVRIISSSHNSVSQSPS
jgi:hypothetical protein